MKIINQYKGFTLVETLVAISVLMIAIAGPLTVANKAFTSAINARNQSIASNLAQEGLEYVNYMKANNIWPDGVQWVHVDSVYPPVPNLFKDTGCGLYECDDGAINLSAPSAPFVRSYIFNYRTNGFSDADQVLVTVKVAWNTGAVSNQVQLQEILTDFER